MEINRKILVIATIFVGILMVIMGLLKVYNSPFQPSLSVFLTILIINIILLIITIYYTKKQTL